MNTPNPCDFSSVDDYNNAALAYREVVAAFLTPEQFATEKNNCAEFAYPQVYYFYGVTRPPNPCQFASDVDYNRAVAIYRELVSPLLSPQLFSIAKQRCFPMLYNTTYFIPFDYSRRSRPRMYYPYYRGVGSRPFCEFGEMGGLGGPGGPGGGGPEGGGHGRGGHVPFRDNLVPGPGGHPRGRR